MGVKVGDFKLVYESVTMTALDPEYLEITEEQIGQYLKEHPMPDDPAYSKDDLIHDLTGSSGFYCLPKETKEETAGYIEDMLNQLLEKNGDN